MICTRCDKDYSRGRGCEMCGLCRECVDEVEK
jgi:hypothetical protein